MELQYIMKPHKCFITTLFAFVCLSVFAYPNPAQAKVKTNDINFPGNLYTTEIKSCKAMGNNSFNSKESIKLIEGLIGYDWVADWKANSTSLSVNHENITTPMNKLMSATHNAIGND